MDDKDFRSSHYPRGRSNSTTSSESSNYPRGNLRSGRWNDRGGRGNRGHINSGGNPRGDRLRGRGRGGFYSSNTQQDDNEDNNKSRAYNEQVAAYGISYQKIEDLCNAMDQQKILPGSAELLTAVQAESFYKRLDDLWPDVKKQSNFLRVIVATASTNQADLLHLTHDFASKVFSSSLLEKVIGACICPLMFDKDMQQQPIYADIAHHTVKLMLLGFNLLPSKMDVHLPKALNVITSLKEVKEICLKEETKIQLERLEISMKDRHEAKAAQRVTEETRKKQDLEGSAGEPPMNFREMSIVPTPEDISIRCPPYLRAAKIKGKYESDEQYLDIQFRLLREDLIRPLRDGINAYRKGGKAQTDLFVYNDVEIGSSTMHKQTGELISFASIVVSKRMRWDKRLKFGSLVCLSSDDFQQVFLFATVLEREQLPEGKVGLKFEEVSKINTKWKYKMVESPAFFEAYRHVMMALQAIEVDEPIPFSQYLVNVETEIIPPLYSIDQEFDFKTLLKKQKIKYDEDGERIERKTKFFLHELSQLKPADFGMDESQFEALQYALTSQLAILQGPPGTGKTFMGLQIAKLLFDNWNIWNPDMRDARPMLVVCYTNHALDQFLEGISKFVNDGIIRVGGRSKSEALAKFNLANMRRWDNSTIRNNFFNIRSETNAIQNELEKHSTNLKELQTCFANPELLRNALFDTEKQYLNTAAKLRIPISHKENQNETFMSKWLTQTDKEYPVETDDLKVIRQLMAWKIPEIKAKNGLAVAYHKQVTPNAFQISYFLKSKQGSNYSSTQLIPSARYWPEIGDIDRVMKMGFSEMVAAEMLVRSNVEQIREAQGQSKRPKTTQQQLVAAPKPVDPVTEALAKLAFQDDDEENRMIEDTNVLDDFQKVEKKKAKEKPTKWYNEEIIHDYYEHIISARPMTEEEANQVEDVWALPLQQRWKLYQYWIRKSRKEVKEKIKALEGKYGKKVKMLIELRSLVDVDVLKNAKVVGMTTTGAAKHQSTLRALRPRIIIVEEAAEVLEAHLVTALTRACQHSIFIGDHQQLRPNPAVYDLAKKFNFDVSLFERLIKNGYPYRMLKNQHRMCTDISQVLMPQFYEDLLDDPSVFEKEPVKGVTKNLMFINHSYPEVTEKEFKSHKNNYEAEYALRLAFYFVQQTYKSEQITILCTYLDQLLDLRKRAVELYGKDHGFVIQSVDNYQGEENDIVILSLVRSNNHENKIGFLKISNRVCVALSRAKLGLYVICNMDFLANNCEMWEQIRQRADEAGALSNELIVSCQMHQNEQTITHYNEFDTKCLEGGCNVPCNGRLECGHQCIKPCHVEDMEHKLTKCQKPCERKCNSGHPCKKDCWKPCGKCYVRVVKHLPCQHQKVDYCYLDPEDVQCDKACQKTLECGHRCKERCGEECTQYCKEKVQRQVPGCGHIVTVNCGQSSYSIKCKTRVIKKWPLCNHTVETECSSDVDVLPCPYPCNTALAECGHRCKGSCGQCRNGRLHIACSQKCNKIFLCEHECEAKCSKICPPCEKPCETACAHSQCGNQSIKGQQIKKTRKLMNQQKGCQSGRRCGEPCPPCMEKCLNRCEHRQCSNKCGEACDVGPCMEPCMKLLPCHKNKRQQKNDKNGKSDDHHQHCCIGVCGEDCLKICKICNPEKFADIQKIFFGNEDDENARFVQLKDCGHIFEATGLDQWIESSLKESEDQNGSTEIIQIKCPQCKTPIRRSKRYISILNERAIDIEQIKQKTRGLTDVEKNREQEIFKKDVKQVFAEFNKTDFGLTIESKELEGRFIEANPNQLTKNWFSTSRNILRIIQTLTKYVNAAKENIEGFGAMTIIPVNMANFAAKLMEFNISSFSRYLREECHNIIQRINPFTISELMLQQITYEVQRFAFMVDLFSYFSKAVDHSVDFTPTEIQMITTIFDDLNGSKEFDDSFAREMSQKLEELAMTHRVSNFGISKKERIEIIRALGSHVRHWYKCPNGHHYGIGECGNAIITTKCPECQAEIGGGSHQLLATNQDAQSEMFEGTGMHGEPSRNPFEVRYL